MKVGLNKTGNSRVEGSRSPVQFEEKTSTVNRALEPAPTAIVRDGGVKALKVTGINRSMPSQVRK